MNLNKIKKIAVKFPNWIDPVLVQSAGNFSVTKFKEARNINLELGSQLFAHESAISIGVRKLPYIEGFNATMLNDKYYAGYFAMQFTFASGEEKKVQRIIEKYSGVVIPLRGELQQWGTHDGDDEDNKRNQYENVNEYLDNKDFERRNN